MRTLGLAMFGFAVAVAACGGGGVPKPCGWYFASDRANVRLGPIRWLTGVWRGSRATGDQIWTKWNGSIAGVWRREESPGSDRFYTVREDGAKITLVEIAPSGTSTTYEAVEQGERVVVFSNAEHGKLRLEGAGHDLELTIETKDGTVERHHFWLEI